MKRIGLVAAVLVVLPLSSASAAGVVLGREGSQTVFIWKDSEAYKEAISLIDAGVHKTNPVLVFRLMSCTVKSGTRAIVTDGGFFSSTIMIVDGEETGCRGLVPNEDIRD